MLEGREFGVGGVLSLAIDPQSPTTVYAGTGGGIGQVRGVFKTVNSGTGWSEVNEGLSVP